jgi:aminobenzoyl-glutamate transport protein
MPGSDSKIKPRPTTGWLGWIERIGNRLPDPATLFLIGTVLVMVASAVAAKTQWVVEERLPEQTAALGQAAEPSAVKWVATGKIYEANNILTRDGLFWAISSMVKNFINFAPLGIVLVGMLGIGIAERTGFIGSALKAMLMVVPKQLLTPAVVFMGIMSSLTSDAGYIILPPLAAAGRFGGGIRRGGGWLQCESVHHEPRAVARRVGQQRGAGDRSRLPVEPGL